MELSPLQTGTSPEAIPDTLVREYIYHSVRSDRGAQMNARLPVSFALDAAMAAKPLGVVMRGLRFRDAPIPKPI